MLAAGESQDAREGCRELERIAQGFDTEVLRAIAAHARGVVALADGDAHVALVALRSAWQIWRRVEAPYIVARVRALMAIACHALGDKDGYELELAAARAVFEELGAAPDLARIASLTQGTPSSARSHGLTPRELEVLRLVVAGKSNKVIVVELCLSEKTIHRHVSNIFTKLDVPSRAAATAFAYQHKLL